METETLLADCGARLQGSARFNHQRVTPLGTLRSAWLSPEEVPVAPSTPDACWWWVSAAFWISSPILRRPRCQQGISADTAEIELPELDVLRETRANFAR
jgi:glycerol-3-phosphate dehydrogenase subunit B